MDRSEIVADIRSSLFPTSLLRGGYDMRAVDDVLDDLVARIEADEAADEIERFVTGLSFATAVGGYDEAPVDDLLSRVVSALQGRDVSVGGLEPTSAPGGTTARPERQGPERQGPERQGPERQGPEQQGTQQQRTEQDGPPQQGSALIEPRQGFFARLFGR